MRTSRMALLLCLATVLCTPAAHAETTRSGTVIAPAATPSIARALYQANSGTNGWAGYVIPLPPSAVGAKYVLRRTAGTTGRENLDAWFYSDLSSANPKFCRANLTTDSGDTERGGICDPGAPIAAVIVVIWVGPDDSYGVSAGANAAFTFTY